MNKKVLQKLTAITTAAVLAASIAPMSASAAWKMCIRDSNRGRMIKSFKNPVESGDGGTSHFIGNVSYRQSAFYKENRPHVCPYTVQILMRGNIHNRNEVSPECRDA